MCVSLSCKTSILINCIVGMAAIILSPWKLVLIRKLFR